MNSILEFHDIARAFELGIPVLDGVSFSMQREEVVGLLGRNGAGKTTLIHIAMGLLFPHRGTVRAFGLSPFDEPVAVKRRIGYVSEGQVMPPRSTIADLLEFHRYLFPRWDRLLEKELLEKFDLGRVNLPIQLLSKGKARQVALICAVCHRPELLILDEPAGGLDPAARREFLETSIQLLNREGSAILFSSHHMSDVERLGGRVVLLDKGKVRLDQQIDALRESYCVVVVSQAVVASVEAIERVPGFLRARASFDSWHAVFEGAPHDIVARIHSALGFVDVQCATVPLEELFIELVGGDRNSEAKWSSV